MVHDLVRAAVVGVLVRERVEAVRAARDDRRDPRPVQRLDVRLGERLEQVLVAHPASGVAGASLARPEDREVDAGRGQEPGDAPRRLLRAFVERAGAADPEQVLGRGVTGLEDPDPLEPGRPVDPRARRLPPRVLALFDASQHRLGLAREP